MDSLVSKKVSHSAVSTKLFWWGSPCIEQSKALYFSLKSWSGIEECQIGKKFKNCESLKKSESTLQATKSGKVDQIA